jgi:aldose 1-epimerase
MSIIVEDFGKTPDGEQVSLFTLTNKAGLRAKITNYGGIVVSLEVPDKNGRFDDVVLGFDNLEQYFANVPYLGCIVGRFANRIAGGKFTLDDVEYTLAVNNGPNHLHGGIKGFNKALWDAQPIENDPSAGLKLKYISGDGEEGYPGNLACTVIYRLTDENELKIDYHAQTDKPTIINLTNHSYFNLAGHDKGSILAHRLSINADHFTPSDETLKPTGQIVPVKDTPLDFTTRTAIGEQIEQVGGYDNNYVLNNSDPKPALAAEVCEINTGRVMQVYTTLPGMQFYTGNFLGSSIKGKDGAVYDKHTGFCLETQHFPDSPNRDNFPSVVLRPDGEYKHTTSYKFTVL